MVSSGAARDKPPTRASDVPFGRVIACFSAEIFPIAVCRSLRCGVWDGDGNRMIYEVVERFVGGVAGEMNDIQSHEMESHSVGRSSLAGPASSLPT